MSESGPFQVLNQFGCKLAIVQEMAVFIPLPGTKVHLVYGNRILLPVRIMPLLQPGDILPLIGLFARNARGSGRALFKVLPVWISFKNNMTMDTGADLVLVGLPDAQAGYE